MIGFWRISRSFIIKHKENTRVFRRGRMSTESDLLVTLVKIGNTGRNRD
jgi:hypothetical protein